MFNYKDSQETINSIKSYFSSIPRDADDVEQFLRKVKNIFSIETENSTEMWETYQKMITGDATPNEITAANKKLQELLVTTRFAFLLAIPGSIIALPAIIKFAEGYGINLIPDSVATEFGI